MHLYSKSSFLQIFSEGEPQTLHHSQHGLVFQQHISIKIVNAAISCHADYPLHQSRSQAFALPGISHQDGKFALLPVGGYYQPTTPNMSGGPGGCPTAIRAISRS